MTLLIVMLLLGLTSLVSFETGRRWEKGRKELKRDRYASSREPVGRRGTLKLNTLRIRR